MKTEKPKRLPSLLRRIRWQPQESKSVKVCPRCGSSSLKFSSKLDVWLTPRRYVCNDCGYVGPIVLEIEKTEGEEEAGEG